MERGPAPSDDVAPTRGGARRSVDAYESFYISLTPLAELIQKCDIVIEPSVCE